MKGRSRLAAARRAAWNELNGLPVARSTSNGPELVPLATPIAATSGSIHDVRIIERVGALTTPQRRGKPAPDRGGLLDHARKSRAQPTDSSDIRNCSRWSGAAAPERHQPPTDQIKQRLVGRAHHVGEVLDIDGEDRHLPAPLAERSHRLHCAIHTRRPRRRKPKRQVCEPAAHRSAIERSICAVSVPSA